MTDGVVPSETPKSIVFAGFRETGKTTFLVALWHTIVKNEVPGALTLENFYEGDREYINSRHAEWLSYEPVKRTLVDLSTPIKMTLRDAKRDRLLQLGIPDLSGETFKVQFEERHASKTFAQAVNGAVGFGIFINPIRVEDPTRIREAWDALDGEPEETDAPDGASMSEPAPDGPPAVPKDDVAGSENGGRKEVSSDISGVPSKKAPDFKAEMCCTQVKYVDLLQQLVEHGVSTPLRCAVIVSAMDRLDGTPFENRPEDFIRARMSLFDQFLHARKDLFEARIYGVSAQGGEYDAASVESLAKLGADRIRLSVSGKRDNDITRPLRWLAFGEE
jgi:hypothetical protein